MLAASPNPPTVPINTPAEDHPETNATNSVPYDALLDALSSRTANRALGDPTFVPPNSPALGANEPLESVDGLYDATLVSPVVRDQVTYTLNRTVEERELASQEMELVNGETDSTNHTRSAHEINHHRPSPRSDPSMRSGNEHPEHTGFGRAATAADGATRNEQVNGN